MPYNNTPIAPSSDITGAVSLPRMFLHDITFRLKLTSRTVARVKKIIQADPDIATCSNNAAFAITVATEQFLQYLVEKTHNVAKAEQKKARRNIQYKDIANAVARHDNLEFLTDVVPRTITYKAYKDKEKAKKASAATAAVEPASTLANGQRTLDGPVTNGAKQDEEMDVDADESAENGSASVETNSAEIHAATQMQE